MSATKRILIRVVLGLLLLSPMLTYWIGRFNGLDDGMALCLGEKP